MNNQQTEVNFNCINIFENNIITIKNYKTNQVIGYTSLQDMIPLEPIADTDKQQFIVYRLDGEKYLIAHTFSGDVIQGVRGGLVPPYYKKEWVNADIFAYQGNVDPEIRLSPNWIIQNTDISNTYQLLNMQWGLYLVPYDQVYGSNYLGAIIQGNNDKHTYWIFQSIATLQPIARPKLERLHTFPQYKQVNETLPFETSHQLIGWTLLPYAFVKDHQLENQKRIKLSPYYVLEKYQYWKCIEHISLGPGEIKNSSYTYGTTSTIQQTLETHLGIIISQDGGFLFKKNRLTQYGGLTFDIKKKILNDLHIHEAITDIPMESITEEYVYTNPFQTKLFSCMKYILATKLVLKRVSQNDHDPYIEVEDWIFTDGNTIKITSYPLF
ncbi:hypothetical protein PDJ95_29655 [Bacillus cereus]|nr:hypothetical protein [Bacillus cereus]